MVGIGLRVGFGGGAPEPGFTAESAPKFGLETVAVGVFGDGSFDLGGGAHGFSTCDG